MTSEHEEGAATAGAPDAEPGDLPSNVDQLKSLLEEEHQKAKSYMANWQRAAADYQNYKRRVEDERQETARLSNAAFVINLLPLLDDLERALTNVDANLAGLTWVDGIRLIHRKFQALLEMSGVQEIDADGAMFDPSRHEAVSQGPGEENKVIAVVQKGYKLGDRVIRPAMVVVGNGSPRDAKEQQGGQT
jgi:molecular chaperone GrpE